MSAVISIQRTGARMDRFSATLPAFKAAAIVKAEGAGILAALDAASGADDAEHFEVWMNAAECGVLRMERHLAALKAEIARGRS